jgi:methyl-accepting chemotaxis protein
MKIKFRLSLLVIAIMAVVVTGIAALLLRKASGISVDLTERSLEFLASQRAEYWKGREDGYIRALHTLASVMGGYESIPAEDRRKQYDDMLKSTLEAEPNIVSLYTVWKPNALDGMDEHYIGRIGSSPTGQYAIVYTKETGKLTTRTSGDVDDMVAYITGPNAMKDRVENPMPRTINGKDTLTFRMSAPIINNRTREVVGGVGCVLAIDVVQTIFKDTLTKNDIIEMAEIYSDNGTILAHFMPERVGRNLLEADVELGEDMPAIYAAIQNKNAFKGDFYHPTIGSHITYVLQPFQIGDSDQNWAILIGVSEAYIMKEVKSISKFTVLLAVIGLIISAIIAYFVLDAVTKPIVKVAETLKDISEGEGDLTRTIEEHGNDEIADLSRYFNKTLEKIKNLIVTIKGQTVNLSGIGGELANNMNDTASAINEITSNIQSIKGRVINQSASVTQTNATMGQITVNIDKLNNHVEYQTSSMARSSSAVEEMLANIRSVTGTLVKNGACVKELTFASDEGRVSLENVTSDIHEIARQSGELMKINAVMNNIAGQTNLLSMNAAIEAAHAGEAGRGFAVVAAEIRKLAEESSEQSTIISNVLNKTKKSIEKITESIGNVLTKFEAIDTGVKTVSQQADQIRIAMEEQDQGSKQIMETFVELNDITQQVKDGSSQMLEGSKEVIQESKNLEQVTQEITGGMNEMAVGAEQINTAVCKVNTISGKTKENIDILVREVSRFKVA